MPETVPTSPSDLLSSLLDDRRIAAGFRLLVRYNVAVRDGSPDILEHLCELMSERDAAQEIAEAREPGRWIKFEALVKSIDSSVPKAR